jgi:peptide/nickel transport system permease protein
MVKYILKRILMMIPTMLAVSLIAFAIIQLPPGDFLTSKVAELEARGDTIEEAVLAGLRKRYGLDKPIYVQYWRWISAIVLRGDFGYSFDWLAPVNELIWVRFGLTFALSATSFVFIWAVAFPVGIYSAIRRYSVGDYVATLLGFIGLAVPNFLLALVLMYFSFKTLGQSVGGLFSPEYIDAPWGWEKAFDLVRHLWIPVVIIGLSGTANLIRIMRANLLDELQKPYVTTARAKGLTETKILLKYPVRLALNPFISTLGWMLPQLVSGESITSMVLNLPTTGPLMLHALMTQDMFLAGAFVLLLSSLTVVGTLISDILLAMMDPRIHYQET